MEFITQRSAREIAAGAQVLASRARNNYRMVQKSEVFEFLLGRDLKKNFATLSAFLEKRGAGPLLAAAAIEPLPAPVRIAVVIPVFNGGAAFVRCLAGVRALSPPPDELIVIDDCSTDGSAELAQSAGARVHSLPVRGGPAAARNLGARRADSPLIVFLDADVIPQTDRVASLRAGFAETPSLSAAFGSYDDAPDARTFISQYKNLFHHFIHQNSSRDASTFWSGCGAVRRPAFLALGGFDERYTQPCIEDIELGVSLARGRASDRLAAPASRSSTSNAGRCGISSTPTSSIARSPGASSCSSAIRSRPIST